MLIVIVIFLIIVLVVAIIAAISPNLLIFLSKKLYLKLKKTFPEYYAQREETLSKLTKGIRTSTIDHATFWIVRILAIMFAISAAFFLLLFLWTI